MVDAKARSRSRALIAGGAIFVVLVLVGVVVIGERRGRADEKRGHRSSLVTAPGDSDQIWADRDSLVIGERLLTRGHRVEWRDASTLQLIGSVPTSGRWSIGVDPLTVVVSEPAGGIAAHSEDGEELWRREGGQPVAASRDGAVTLASCEAVRCTLISVTPDDAVRWEAELDGGEQPVSFADGVLLTFPGEHAAVALPAVVVATVARGDRSGGFDVVRLHPATGQVQVIQAVDGTPEVLVTDEAIAVLSDPDAPTCVLSLWSHDGAALGEMPGDCTDPADAVDSAYLYAEANRFVWVGADTIRIIDASTGVESTSVPLGDPAGVPTPAGVLRAGDAQHDGWSLRRIDGTEVLTSGWEWRHDVTADAVLVGRLVDVGPFWGRSSVHEVAVVDVTTGEVCAWQRVAPDPFPVAKALPGCRALVSSAAASSDANGEGDGLTTWLLGG